MKIGKQTEWKNLFLNFPNFDRRSTRRIKKWKLEDKFSSLRFNHKKFIFLNYRIPSKFFFDRIWKKWKLEDKFSEIPKISPKFFDRFSLLHFNHKKFILKFVLLQNSSSIADQQNYKKLSLQLSEYNLRL